MKIRLLLLLICAVVSVLSGGVKEPRKQVATPSAITVRTLDINEIEMWINNRGYLFDLITGGLGAYWTRGADTGYQNTIVWDQGPWIIGKVKGIPSAAMALWQGSYAPGPIIGGQPALLVRPQDSSRYHPYKISYNTSTTDSDFIAWPTDLGAPSDGHGNPQLLGDQMVWSIYNGADTTALPEDYRVTNTQFPHLPVEVQQSFFARRSTVPNDTSLLANTTFMEWTFINKGSAPIESCYVGFWSDIDFENPDDNVPGVDTTFQLGYCWAPDTGETKQAVGYEMLYGPVTPSPGHFATFRGRQISGYQNMRLSSFRGIMNDYGHDFIAAPNTIAECWNVARGYDQAGETIIDSVTKLPTTFPYSGDPVTGSGWIYSLKWRKGSAGILMFSGPFDLAVGDTQWMLIALIPADGGDRLSSISLLRQYAQRLSMMTYDDIAHPTVLSIGPEASPRPSTFALFPNYPNPFNPTTTIRYALPQRSHVTLSVFNTLGQQVATLVDAVEEQGEHSVRFDGSGQASGVYFYRLKAGAYVATKRLILVR